MKRLISLVVCAWLLIPAAVSADSFMDGSVLKKGFKGPEVRLLQQALKTAGFFDTVETTENFGDATEKSVKAFQAKYGLAADGVAGKGTLAKLRELGYISEPTAASKADDVVSRSSDSRYGIPINWYDIKPQFKAGKTTLTIEDFKTGVQFKVQVSYAATVHADIETLTQKDSETVKRLWGGYSWDRRPVLVHFNGEVYAASMNGLPHAGLDSEQEGVTVSGRSGGFGKGYNFDDIKGNGIDGHFCLHFVGSRTHGSNQIDDKHQANIRIAAGK